MTSRKLGERLVGALKNPLCADIDPTARGHLTVHRQTAVLEIAERVPVCPGGDEQCVGNQYARRPGMGAKHGDRLSRLHDERLVVFEMTKCFADGIERGPASCGAPGSAVDDEILR